MRYRTYYNSWLAIIVVIRTGPMYVAVLTYRPILAYTSILHILAMLHYIPFISLKKGALFQRSFFLLSCGGRGWVEGCGRRKRRATEKVNTYTEAGHYFGQFSRKAHTVG